MVIQTSPIEGFFLTSDDNLLFDVKGLSHPQNRIISFVRYVPHRFFPNKNMLVRKKGYIKIYDLAARYAFLEKYFPHYLFNDPQGRGTLQAVPNEKIQQIHNPLMRLQEIIQQKETSLTPIELITKTIWEEITKKIPAITTAIGISGSVLVNLETKDSDIDLVVYGRKAGKLVYEIMSEIFATENKIRRYKQSELRQLWHTRGQTTQIGFSNFVNLESHKNLQGKIHGRDFYIRLVLLPSEFPEPYTQTTIQNLGEIECHAVIADATKSIFTPCIYELQSARYLTDNLENYPAPKRLFSLRGRYCELFTKGEKIHVSGKLEKVSIKKQKPFLQITLGTLPHEFIKKI
ncbi:MAG: nucleotidyltransferase domain-containing protein [Asgard group archaeon]|nr:nucleotidyltransferase domain-containing protein [Asgard group archaeon]